MTKFCCATGSARRKTVIPAVQALLKDTQPTPPTCAEDRAPKRLPRPSAGAAWPDSGLIQHRRLRRPPRRPVRPSRHPRLRRNMLRIRAVGGRVEQYRAVLEELAPHNDLEANAPHPPPRRRRRPDRDLQNVGRLQAACRDGNQLLRPCVPPKDWLDRIRLLSPVTVDNLRPHARRFGRPTCRFGRPSDPDTSRRSGLLEARPSSSWSVRWPDAVYWWRRPTGGTA